MARKHIFLVLAIVVIIFSLVLVGLSFYAAQHRTARPETSPPQILSRSKEIRGDVPEGQDIEKEFDEYQEALIDWKKNISSKDVEKDVAGFFLRIVDKRFNTIDTYERIVNPIWKAKPELVDEYGEAIKRHPWPKEDPYGAHERNIRMVLEEIERAREPRVAITDPKVRMYVDEFFGKFVEFGGFAGIDSREVALRIVSDADKSKEETIKEYIAALRQHPWPLYDDCGRDYIKFPLFLLDNPEERRGFLQRLEAKRKGQYEIKPVALKIARANVEEFFKKLNSTRSEDKKEDIHFAFWDEAHFRSYEYYLLALKEREPWPLSEEDQEETGFIVRSYTDPDIQPYTWEDGVALDHFNLELAFREGYPQYRQAARECVEELFEGIMSESKKEMKEAGKRFLDKIQQPEMFNEDFFYECELAFRQHPRPIWGKRRQIFWEARNEFYELQAEIVTGRIAKKAEEFLKGIVSKDPLRRKEAIFLLLPKFLPLAVIDESEDLIPAIRKHPLPEDEEAKARIETVIKCFEEQADFFSKRWRKVASPCGDEGRVIDDGLAVSNRLAAAMVWAGEGYFKVDHWPSIVRDENRPLIDRFWAAFYLAKYYLFFDTFASEGKIDLSEFEPDERPMVEAMIELGGKFEKEIERLRAGEDEKIIFWIDLGLAHQEVLQDFRPYVPALLKALESEHLFFRIISQKRLEELTGQQFPLDPTDPPELRAPAIAQWQRWWEENKDKFHYDPMKDRLVQ